MDEYLKFLYRAVLKDKVELYKEPTEYYLKHPDSEHLLYKKLGSLGCTDKEIDICFGI